MARIRTVKPEFFRHHGLYLAEKETGLPLRLAFEGLWTASDREGRFAWKPAELKLDCLPHDDVDFSATLEALEAHGFITSYEAGGKKYGFIPSWHDHQVINNREAPSTIPPPFDASRDPYDASQPNQPRVTDLHERRHGLAQGEGKGREGKGREEEGKDASRDASASGPVCLIAWYCRHQVETGRLVMPSAEDRKAALDLEARYLPSDLERALAEYWDRWREHWFSVNRGDSKKPPTQRRPVFLFASFARHLEELLQPETIEAEETAMADF